VKLGLTAMALAAVLNLSPNMSPALAQQQQPAVPDAPTPQARPPLTGADGTSITPGIGAGKESAGAGPTSSSTTPDQQFAPSSQAPSAQGKDQVQTTPPELPAPGEGMASLAHFVVNVNFVEVPVTVKDSKGNLVGPALRRLRHRPEPNLRRDGQGEQLPGRHSGRAHSL
jgi:hypothetical protein